MHVLGIDAGGTKTVALLADADGRIVSEGRAGAANLHTEGELEVEKILHTVIDRATDGRDVTLSAVCLGIAGVDREDDNRIIRGIMRRMGYRFNTVIVNDALIALVAGAGANPGVVVVAGTGSIAYGVSQHGLAARSGGWGPTMGDEGSGYWVGRRALAAVMRDADGRGPHTDLTPLVLRHFALPNAEALVAVIYHQSHERRKIASLAAVVDRARSDGDPVAIDIMTRAADELGLAAASVINRLEMRGEQFPILLAGGMLRESTWLASEVRRRMAEVAPRSVVALLTEEPAVGAVRLALAHAKGAVRIPPYIDSIRTTPPTSASSYGAQEVNIERFENEQALSAALATRVLGSISARPTLVLGLPTGRTPLGLYRELRERDRADWSKVRTFNLDEFAGLEPSHPQSYRAFMQAELFDHVSIDPANIGFLNGVVADLTAECRRYEDAIDAAGGIDLQILGIGANGHIGFNEPAEGLCATTHIAHLEEESRRANAQRFGGDWHAVPARALSMGMSTILRAREIVLIATGAEKADAVHGMIEGLITTQLPASLLQVHHHVTVMLDREAASKL